MQNRENIVKLAIFQGAKRVTRLGNIEVIQGDGIFRDYYESEASLILENLNVNGNEIAKLMDNNTLGAVNNVKVLQEQVQELQNKLTELENINSNKDILIGNLQASEASLKAQLEALQANKEVATTEVKQRGRPAKSKEETVEVEKSEENQEPQA